jgi:hypothetical protein
MSDIFYVEASEADVRAALEDVLTAEEMSLLGFEEREKPSDAYEDDGRGEVVTLMVAVVWTANAVAAGVVGGAAWDLTKKAWAALKDRFGDDHVAEAPASEV